MKKYFDNTINQTLKFNTTKENYSYLTDEELLEKYRQEDNPSLKEKYLSSLFSRHNAMLKKLASNAQFKNSNLGTIEDSLQNAYMGCLIAYNRFSSEKAKQNNNHLHTFVYTTVFRYLQSCSDEQGYVQCPSTLREVRSYFAGKYDTDPEKKSKFESKYNINNQESKNLLAAKFSLLKPDSVTNFSEHENDDGSFVDNIILCSDTNDLENSTAIKMAISSLTDLQKKILQLSFIDNLSINKVVKNLSEYSVTPQGVKREINAIKEAFSAWN